MPYGNYLYLAYEDIPELDPVVTHNKSISWKWLTKSKSLVWSWFKNSYNLPMECNQKKGKHSATSGEILATEMENF